MQFNVRKKNQTKLRSSIFWVKCGQKTYLHLLLLLTDKCRDEHVAAAYRTRMIAKKEQVKLQEIHQECVENSKWSAPKE